MKYIEDYLSEKMIDDLTFEIAKICNDDMYIDSTLSAFDNDEQAQQLLDYLRSHPNATRVDVDLCTIRIYNKSHHIT